MSERGDTANGSAAFFRAARKAWHASVAVVLFLIFAWPVRSQQSASAASPDLSDKSLEDLMNTEVTSVSKKEQKLSQVAAAIFVITQEDIRRSGVTNIPDLLRIVPGLDVAQINANVWAISARGFNQQFSNKLLVLLDGRAVYTPSFSGVFWDVLDLPLEDIERIEVIRGPGGTVWGANAVNGVINIISKKAGDTRGGLVSAGGGNLDQGFGTAQYGGSIGTHTDYRGFVKYFNQNHLLNLTGQSGQDGWHASRGGFRTDSRLGANDDLSFEGDLFDAREGDNAANLPRSHRPASPMSSSRRIFRAVTCSRTGPIIMPTARTQRCRFPTTATAAPAWCYPRGKPSMWISRTISPGAQDKTSCGAWVIDFRRRLARQA